MVHFDEENVHLWHILEIVVSVREFSFSRVRLEDCPMYGLLISLIQI